MNEKSESIIEIPRECRYEKSTMLTYLRFTDQKIYQKRLPLKTHEIPAAVAAAFAAAKVASNMSKQLFISPLAKFRFIH